jgi:hypothetical protein
VRKSDIFNAIVLLKSNKPTTEGEILRELCSTLEYMSKDFKQWDKTVDPSIATQIITKIGATKADLSPEQIFGI